MACNCNPCNTCPQTNPCGGGNKCLGQITAADLGELVYIAGLDVNLCKKYSTIIDALGLVDCVGNPITASTPIVTCAGFQARLCAILSALTAGTPIAAGTILVGTDCASHVMPPFQTPITVLDTTTVDLTLAGGVLSAVVLLSDDAGQVIEVRADGLYAPDVCTQLAAIPGPVVPATDATVLVTTGSCTLTNLTNYQENISVLDTPCFDLSFVGNVLSGSPIISPNVGNQLSCSPNGLLVPAVVIPPETPITPVDTASVNLTVSGTNSHTIQADVVVSPDAGNAVEVHANGVYVPDLCTQLGDIGGLVIPAAPGDVFVTVDCEPRTLPVNGGITVLDTTTVDLTLAAGVLSANVEVSSVPDNLLEVRPDGLAVRCTAVQACVPDTVITAIDTNCLNLDVAESPANTFTITGNPIISPTVGNALSCTANGLYVAGSDPATTCAAIQAAFVDNPAVITPGQRILVDNCQTYLAPAYTPLDTNSVDTVITTDGLGNPQFAANVRLDNTYPGLPAGCNGLVIGAGGVSAPAPYPGNAQGLDGPAHVFTGPVAANQIFVSSVFQINISNPSSCRQALLHLVVRFPEIQLQDANPTGGSRINFTLTRHINFPSLAVVQDISHQTLRTFDTNVDFWAGFAIDAPLTIQPGEVGTLGVSLSFMNGPTPLALLDIDRFILRSWVTTI